MGACRVGGCTWPSLAARQRHQRAVLCGGCHRTQVADEGVKWAREQALQAPLHLAPEHAASVYVHWFEIL